MSSSLRVSFSSVFTSADSRKKYLEQSSYAWLFLTCVVDELKKNLTEPVGQLKRDICYMAFGESEFLAGHFNVEIVNAS